jgi:phage portal protein BeeE
MSDDHKLKAQVADGQDAEELINKLSPSFTAIRADLYRSFTKTKFKDSEDRDEVWRKVQSLDWLENNIKRRIRNGENANKTLLQRMKDKFRNQGS